MPRDEAALVVRDVARKRALDAVGRVGGRVVEGHVDTKGHRFRRAREIHCQLVTLDDDRRIQVQRLLESADGELVRKSPVEQRANTLAHRRFRPVDDRVREFLQVLQGELVEKRQELSNDGGHSFAAAQSPSDPRAALRQRHEL